MPCGALGSVHRAAPPGDQADQEQQDHRAAEAGEEAEPQTAALDVDTEQLEQESAEQTADDTDHDVQQDALLSVGLHELAGNPTGESSDDDPADDSETKHHFSYPRAMHARRRAVPR